MCKGVPLLERVARAICEQALYERRGYSSDPQLIDHLWIDFAQQAEAAIEAVTDNTAAIETRRNARESWDGLFFRQD